jgi:hypothetical protein
MHQRNHADDKQTRDQKSDPNEHDRFDHEKSLQLISAYWHEWLGPASTRGALT